ncbi:MULTISPECIES: hypothetical protein [Bradyrhizobium]|uniref:hypothetical protein n=1 Tax=Bradyrhizobium TaxID=374 RepID=UPI00048017CB|nr:MULTISPECIES: hypothetical protein [Bradyrhizobium]RZN11161.1 hypothetical protein CWO90_46595 [Bradyrhizobium sp. Leo121]TAI59910.1 hypothetical protein CWO89_43615 [Bradyrhizobium sp. Leo170]
MELQQHQNETIAVLEDRRTAADGFAALRLSHYPGVSGRARGPAASSMGDYRLRIVHSHPKQ